MVGACILQVLSVLLLLCCVALTQCLGMHWLSLQALLCHIHSIADTCVWRKHSVKDDMVSAACTSCRCCLCCCCSAALH
jgi:hypothetical protein